MVCHNIVFSKPDYVCSKKNAKVSLCIVSLQQLYKLCPRIYAFVPRFVLFFCDLIPVDFIRLTSPALGQLCDEPVKQFWRIWVNKSHETIIWRQQNNAPKTYVYLRHLTMWALFCYILYGPYSLYVPCLKKVTDGIMNECTGALGVCKYMNYCRCIASIGFARQAVLSATLCV